MRTTAPVGIGMISAMLKRYDFQTDLFDVTRYENVYRNPDEDYDASHEQFIRMDVHKDRLNGHNEGQIENKKWGPDPWLATNKWEV